MRLVPVSDLSTDSENVITVFLADDNLLVREGVRALIDRQSDLRIVGVGSDYDEPVTGATAAALYPALPRGWDADSGESRSCRYPYRKTPSEAW